MIIRLYSDITDNESVRYGCAGVSYESIAEALATMDEDDDTIDLRIDCRGGLISAGWAIIDALRATGKTIKATVEGYCGSMAIAVLLAASERAGAKHATLHAHRACFPPYTLADQYNDEDLAKLSEDLKADTERMLDWYVERTGADRTELEALMNADKDIDMEEAQRLGFIQSILEPVSALAGRRSWNKQTPKNKDMAKKENAIGEAFRALAKAIGLKVDVTDEPAPANYVLVTLNGTELVIDKPEGEEIAVGDAASPDGEYVLEDGRKVKIEGGVITEIETADDPEDKKGKKCNLTDEEAAQLQQENADLKAEVERLQAELEEAKKQIESPESKAIVEIVNKAGGREWLNKVTSSNYKPKTVNGGSKNTQKVSKVQKRIEELKA